MPSATPSGPHSPSPPPEAPPTESTPGPRASTIQKLFNDALAHCLRSCSYDNFAKCFPTPAKYVPESLDQLHRDFIGKLETNAKREFANVMEEKNVVTSLNELDKLVVDAKKRKEKAETDAQHKDSSDTSLIAAPTPPHLLPPSSLLSAHLAPFLHAKEAELSSRLEQTQTSNRALADEIALQRAEIERLVNGLAGLVADLEGATIALQGQEMEGIEHELAIGSGTQEV